MTYPKKSLGQNFLIHKRIAERIVHVAEISPQTTVLEIGPGTGMLTRALLSNPFVEKIIAVEADKELVEKLTELFATELKEGRLVLIHEDIRNFSIEKFLSTPYILVANIPYYITGEIIRTFLTTPHKPSSITVLVQKEVAHRIARAKTESILSLSVKVYGDPKYCFAVPRGAFFPAPNVDSAVLSIQNINASTFATKEDEDLFFMLVKTGFAHKRKKLIKNLSEIFDASLLLRVFEELNLPPDVRSENLSLSNWKSLQKNLSR
jgi:16S rRNA (adenine1518-N6/adenine1519-N6)-dimethyltransferase